MSPNSFRLSRSLLLAFAAAALVLLWQSLTVRYNYGGNWTGLFCTGDRMRIPPDLRPGTLFFKNSNGYDGQAYRYVAHDPFFQRSYASYIDAPPLRYRRILIPLAAFLLAGTRQNAIDAAYIAVVLFAIFMGVYWSSVYLVAQGCHYAWGLIFLLTPGALTSIDRMLTDGLLTALFAGLLVYTGRKDDRKVYAVLVLAALTRETGMLLVAGVTAAELLHKRYRRGWMFATAGVPALVWYAVVWRHVGSAAESSLLALFTLPGTGLIARMFTVRTFPGPVLHFAVPILDLLSLLGFIASLTLGFYWAWKSRPGAGAVTIGLFIALALVVDSPDEMIEAYAYSRPLSPLLLFVMLRAVSAGAWWGLAPPLLVTAGVGVFFVSPALAVLRGLL